MTTFILPLHLYVTPSFTLLYPEKISNIQYRLFTKKTVSQKIMSKNTDNKYVSICISYQQFCRRCIYERYSQHDMSASMCIFEGIVYFATTWSKLPTFMLVLLCLYFIWCMFVWAKKITHKMLDNHDYNKISVDN